MESLAPPLDLVLWIKYDLEKGLSVKFSLQNYIKKADGQFQVVLMTWLSLYEQGKPTDIVKNAQSSQIRRSLIEVLERGLKGEPILKTLELLEQEIIMACEAEIDEKVQKLPFLLLIPLLLFQLPAFLLLLFGPLLSMLLSSFGAA